MSEESPDDEVVLVGRASPPPFPGVQLPRSPRYSPDGGAAGGNGGAAGGNGGAAGGNGGAAGGNGGEGGNGGDGGDGGDGDDGEGSEGGEVQDRRPKRSRQPTRRYAPPSNQKGTAQQADSVVAEMHEEHKRQAEQIKALTQKLFDSTEALKEQAMRHKAASDTRERQFADWRAEHQEIRAELQEDIRRLESEARAARIEWSEERTRLNNALADEKKLHKRFRGFDINGLDQEELNKIRQEVRSVLGRVDTAELYLEAMRNVELRKCEFRCVLTQALMKDPVVASDGHLYERETLLEWLNSAEIVNRQLPFASPRGTQFSSRTLMPCHLIRSLIDEAVKEEFEKLKRERDEAGNGGGPAH
jgi:hypothetical protein